MLTSSHDMNIILWYVVLEKKLQNWKCLFFAVQTLFWAHRWLELGNLISFQNVKIPRNSPIMHRKSQRVNGKHIETLTLAGPVAIAESHIQSSLDRYISRYDTCFAEKYLGNPAFQILPFPYLQMFILDFDLFSSLMISSTRWYPIFKFYDQTSLTSTAIVFRFL